MIRLRFFGGWSYPKNLVEGQELRRRRPTRAACPWARTCRRRTAKAPTFAVWALKDPESGNLDRIQIVKGWATRNGFPMEKIYDVAWSDDRKPDAKTGKLPPVGNTVDVKTATYTNDIGDTQLSAVWTDPDFDPTLKAVYYVRVLEIPTPRWSTYDSVKNRSLPLSEGVPATIQERAWSSPIWYTPASRWKTRAKECASSCDRRRFVTALRGDPNHEEPGHEARRCTPLIAAELACSRRTRFAADSARRTRPRSGRAEPAEQRLLRRAASAHSASPDAFALGTRNDADDAYRLCQGRGHQETPVGEMIQKKTPYDWAAVTDHAEYLGMMPLAARSEESAARTEIGKLIASGDQKKGEAAFQQIITSATINDPIRYLVDPKIMKSAWQKQIDAANKHYEPGKFTTLIAFEWSSQPNSKNLHHNVFFRDDKGPDRPFSSFDSVRREDLWTYQEVPARAWARELLDPA